MATSTQRVTIDRLYRILWDSLPSTLTHTHNLPNWLDKLKGELYRAGWNWRDDEHVQKFLICAERRGVLRVDGHCVARGQPLSWWPEAHR